MRPVAIPERGDEAGMAQRWRGNKREYPLCLRVPSYRSTIEHSESLSSRYRHRGTRPAILIEGERLGGRTEALRRGCDGAVIFLRECTCACMRAMGGCIAQSRVTQRVEPPATPRRMQRVGKAGGGAGWGGCGEGYLKETWLFLSLDNMARIHVVIGELDVNQIRHNRLPTRQDCR